MSKNYRQGEVLIFRKSKEGVRKFKSLHGKDWQEKATQVKDNVIIEGELAGHKHQVTNGKLYKHPDKKDMMILEAQDGCIVTHPEHKTIKMPKGTYEIKIQREYDEGKARKVKD